MPNVRDEYEALVRASVKTAAAKGPAVQALKDFVRAAEKLSNQWDEDVLGEGYPKGLPSFDDFVAQLDTWLEKVQAG